RRNQTLGENVHDVIIGIGPIVELRAKRVLPLLRLKHMFGVWCMKNEAFKLNLAQPRRLWTCLNGPVQVIADAILSFNESYFRIKVRTDLATPRDQFKPVGLKIESRPQIGLPRGEHRGSRLRRETVNNQISKEYQASISAGGLVKTV